MKNDHQIVTTNELIGVEIIKYLLSRLVVDHVGIERMAEELDHDEKLVSEVLDFFIDIGWIRQNTNGTYRITSKAIERT
jgi:DNA-binding IclR family transcriptional regulator